MNNTEVSIDSDSLVFIAMPSYSGRAPQLSMKRLESISGNNARCVLVVSYGNREYEDTLVEMYDMAVKCGFIPIAAISGIAEHSIDRETAKGRPDSLDKDILKAFGDKIISSWNSLNELKFVPGNRPYKDLSTGSNCPMYGNACVKCGKCKKVCPVNAIGDDMTGDDEKCISCMRCIKVCPKGARALDDNTIKRIHEYLLANCKTRKEPELIMNICNDSLPI